MARLISSKTFAPLLAGRGVVASLAGLAAFLALASFGTAALALPLAWPLGALFFWPAAFFEAAFSGVACARCSANAAVSVVLVACAFF